MVSYYATLAVTCYTIYLRRFSENRSLVVGPLRPYATLSWCLVCVICNSKSFHFFIQTLHNDRSHIENVHLLFCTHFMNFVLILMGVEPSHVFDPKCLGGA